MFSRRFHSAPALGSALAVRGDVLRVLGAKKPRGDASQLDAVRKMIHDRVHDADSLRALADEILVTQQIAVGLRQADPKEVGA